MLANDLISKMVEENKGWKSPMPLTVLSGAILLCGILTTFLVIFFTWSGVRSNAMTQFLTSPRFGLEFFGGFILVALACGISLALTRPGNPLGFSFLGKFLFLLYVAYIVLLLFSLFYPSLPPSMAGKRPYCLEEVIIYSLCLLALFLFSIRRSILLFPYTTGLYGGLFCGLIPALFMHIGCMYDPVHVLEFHFLPILIPILVSIVLCARQAHAYRKDDNLT